MSAAHLEEEVVDLRDCGVDARASTASTSLRTRASSSSAATIRWDSSSEINWAGLADANDELDVDSVLRALMNPEAYSGLSEILAHSADRYAGNEPMQSSPSPPKSEAGSAAPSPAAPAVSGLQLPPGETRAFGFDWLTLTRRSSCSVQSGSEVLSASDSVFEPRASIDAGGSRFQANVDLVQEEILRSLERDSPREPSSPAVAEETISVVDVDEMSPASQADDESMHIVYGASVSSPGSSFFASPRPLENTVSSLLHRLTFDHRLDESIASSIQRVLEVQELLPDASRLSEEEIQALPQIRFTGEKQQCAICLDAFQEHETLTVLRCAHFFHTQCVANWMQRATHCPLCRTCCFE
ncbi:unnamed protein product [Effrenium voratum]|uniref:RING-type domain-containing protein n=1 Tax=Effrenium voratum TaxID=2562239 RepID=A0AA36IY97_9DINO|nr:unnamed protein product [Effrenium voratum]CAJ1439712.1 unnamed protein product [Effrenium voratum]